MNNKLYVGNLPFAHRDEDLRQVFEAHGNVTSARVVTDRESGRSRGFGFVEFATAEEAERAIAALNGSSVGNRNLVVNIARPQTERAPRQERRDRW